MKKTHVVIVTVPCWVTWKYTIEAESPEEAFPDVENDDG